MTLPPDLELIHRVAPEMLRPSNNRNDWCDESGPDQLNGGYSCTRPKGHLGPHVSLTSRVTGYRFNSCWENE